jgi:hypothetical protein
MARGGPIPKLDGGSAKTSYRIGAKVGPSRLSERRIPLSRTLPRAQRRGFSLFGHAATLDRCPTARHPLNWTTRCTSGRLQSPTRTSRSAAKLLWRTAQLAKPCSPTGGRRRPTAAGKLRPRRESPAQRGAFSLSRRNAGGRHCPALWPARKESPAVIQRGSEAPDADLKWERVGTGEIWAGLSPSRCEHYGVAIYPTIAPPSSAEHLRNGGRDEIRVSDI